MTGPCLCGDPECPRCFPGAYGARIIRVYAACCDEWLMESEVHMVDIAEDLQGHDVVTFDCPRCGHEHKSKRVG
jgi:hypothetical protein